MKFEDRNGNGEQDSGEPGLPGVEIRVEGEHGPLLRGLTLGDGAFEVCGMHHGGSFRVTEDVPFGYRQTAPLDDRISRRLIAQGNGYFVLSCNNDFDGLNFGNQLIPNAIGGIKFEDLDADGVRDAGEPGLAGFTITLTSTAAGGPAPRTVVTDANGNFLFENVTPGSYTLSETLRQGFSLTVPAANSIPVTLAADGSSINNVFGNFRGVLTGTVSGTKFSDLNGNGIRDAGEPGLAGVNDHAHRVDQRSHGLTAVGRHGRERKLQLHRSLRRIHAQRDGSGRVRPDRAAGRRGRSPRRSTSRSGASPGSSSATVRSGDGDDQRREVQRRQRQRRSRRRRAGTLRSDDPGDRRGRRRAYGDDRRGRRVLLHRSSRRRIRRLRGRSDGVHPDRPRRAGDVHPDLAAGQTISDLLFGNRASTSPSDTGSITGRKILDFDGDGIVDGEDRGFEGIVFELRDAAGTVRTATSNANGDFTFSNLPAGTYVLTEILPDELLPDVPRIADRSGQLHDHAHDGTDRDRIPVPEQMLRAHSRGGVKMRDS